MKNKANKVAIVKWWDNDEIAQAIGHELSALGYTALYFRFDQPIPNDVDTVFSFAPYGKLLPLASKVSRISPEKRPIFVHWNTEGMPDLRIPWGAMSALSACRSYVDRLSESDNRWLRAMANKSPISWVNKNSYRFRYLGDYHYAYRKGWLNVFADSSAVYAQLHSQHGLPTVVAPWGSTQDWYAELGLARDIDVLWMGKRGTKRRSDILDRVREELNLHGVEIYVADNEENPFVFGEERTRFLNRAKITLNITRTWYDDNFSRFAMAAPNRSLIVSEPLLPHCPAYKSGLHYVSAPIEDLAKTILYYLDHQNERQRIVENAYRLSTTEVTFANSIKNIMKARAGVAKE